MFSLKTYLVEGGNLVVDDVSAAPIEVTGKNRKTVQGDLHGMFSALHSHVEKAGGGHIFGKGMKALQTGSAYSGSTAHLFDKGISDQELQKHKSKLGDADVKVNKEHFEDLGKHLQKGAKYGKYTVSGYSKGGGEHHVLMKHENGNVHQVDFEGTDYHKDEPNQFAQFSHSSHWNDTKAGIKGAHHKILLNAAASPTHKFSILHGLSPRGGQDHWDKNVSNIAKTVFGKKATTDDISSFHGIASAIKTHIPASRHQEIYDKFSSDMKKHKKIDSKNAIAHLGATLGIKSSVNEAVEPTHHAAVVPMAGFSPISHMGHAVDLGGTLNKLPGKKFVGISAKAEAFSPQERAGILQRQWSSKGDTVHAHVISGVGEIIRKAHDSLPKGKKVLHLVGGADRKSFIEGIKSSLVNGKIKEMEGKSFDEIHTHFPKDENREHGMSGTKMRNAANEGNLEVFHKHLGSMFSHKEAKTIMDKVKAGISSGDIPLDRTKSSKKIKTAVKESDNFYENKYRTSSGAYEKNPRNKSGLSKKYSGDLSHSTQLARKAHWEKTSKMADDNPAAYTPAPGDESAKTKESKYTKRYRERFGEENMKIPYLLMSAEQKQRLSEMNTDSQQLHFLNTTTQNFDMCPGALAAFKKLIGKAKEPEMHMMRDTEKLHAAVQQGIAIKPSTLKAMQFKQYLGL